MEAVFLLPQSLKPPPLQPIPRRIVGYTPACSVHPKLETIQHLSFSNPASLPWLSLIERIREIETDSEPSQSFTSLSAEGRVADPDDAYVKAILAYLNQRGYQMASFDRIRKRIDESLTDAHLKDIIRKYPGIFREATLKDSVAGIAKLVP